MNFAGLPIIPNEKEVMNWGREDDDKDEDYELINVGSSDRVEVQEDEEMEEQHPPWSWDRTRVPVRGILKRKNKVESAGGPAALQVGMGCGRGRVLDGGEQPVKKPGRGRARAIVRLNNLPLFSKGWGVHFKLSLEQQKKEKENKPYRQAFDEAKKARRKRKGRDPDAKLDYGQKFTAESAKEFIQKHRMSRSHFNYNILKWMGRTPVKQERDEGDWSDDDPEVLAYEKLTGGAYYANPDMVLAAGLVDVAESASSSGPALARIPDVENPVVPQVKEEAIVEEDHTPAELSPALDRTAKEDQVVRNNPDLHLLEDNCKAVVKAAVVPERNVSPSASGPSSVMTLSWEMEAEIDRHRINIKGFDVCHEWVAYGGEASVPVEKKTPARKQPSPAKPARKKTITPRPNLKRGTKDKLFPLLQKEKWARKKSITDFFAGWVYEEPKRSPTRFDAFREQQKQRILIRMHQKVKEEESESQQPEFLRYEDEMEDWEKVQCSQSQSPFKMDWGTLFYVHPMITP